MPESPVEIPTVDKTRRQNPAFSYMRMSAAILPKKSHQAGPVEDLRFSFSIGIEQHRLKHFLYYCHRHHQDPSSQCQADDTAIVEPAISREYQSADPCPCVSRDLKIANLCRS